MIRSTDEEPKTLAERYASAIAKGHLTQREGPADLDLIVAAGLLDTLFDRESPARSRFAFGQALLRLRVEYDTVRGEHQAAEMLYRNRMAAAPKETGEEGGLSAEERTEQMIAEAQAAALTAHALILIQLPSLHEVKQMVGGFTYIEARRRKFEAEGAALMSLAGSVLDVHMSPTCRTCLGRGFLGNLAKGERQAICRHCRGIGTRRDTIGSTNEARAFAGHLLMELDAIVGKAADELRRGLSMARLAKERLLETERAAYSKL